LRAVGPGGAVPCKRIDKPLEAIVPRILTAAPHLATARLGKEKCGRRRRLFGVVIDDRLHFVRQRVLAIEVRGRLALSDAAQFGRRHRQAVISDAGNRVGIIVAHVAAAHVHAVLVVAEVERRVEVEAGAARAAGEVNAAPLAERVTRGADEHTIVQAGHRDNPAADKFVEDDVRLEGPAALLCCRARAQTARRRKRIEPRLADEVLHRHSAQQVAIVVVNADVLPRHLHHLLAVGGSVHVRPIAVRDAASAGGQAGAVVTFERAQHALRAGCRSEKTSQREAACPAIQHGPFPHELQSCAADAEAMGARMPRPGATPVTRAPSRTTSVPFTSTYWMPAEYCAGFSKVARSMTRSGSKTVRSASAPARTRPLFFIAGTRASSRCAGISVILRSASIRLSTWCCRT